MNKRIILLPLDERPCNTRFPAIMPKAGVELIVAPTDILGLKKRPADTAVVADWVRSNSRNAAAVIVSLDTLVYGGLIPSRLHHDSVETLCARTDLLREIKQKNPEVKIYAFQTIMRCPWYSLSDEEPDYYADFGSEIHKYGRYSHKEMLGMLTAEEEKEFSAIKKKIPSKALDDYTDRRKKNLEVLKHSLRLVGDGTIDYFIIPQDDSAPYGFTALDQLEIRKYLKEQNLDFSVPIYPAADDTGMTMLACAVNELHKVRPKIYVYYASANGPFVTPSFEDRTIDATVKNQIRAAGCRRVYSILECDILLAVNIGSEMLYLPTPEKRTVPYDIERSLPEYIDQIEYALELGKVVAVADVANPTASDLELVELLRDRGLLLKIHAYAGWNTSSNTLGTVICQSCLYLSGKDERGNRDFLLHRYYDDVGYCSHSRTFIDETAVPENGCTVFVLDGVRGKCVAAAKTELMRYMAEKFPTLAALVEDIDVSSPWNRTFEMDFVLITKD